jgi:subtilase family serine protease
MNQLSHSHINMITRRKPENLLVPAIILALIFGLIVAALIIL